MRPSFWEPPLGLLSGFFFGPKKNVGLTIFLVRKFVWSEIVFGWKKMLVQKKCGPKFFFGLKNLLVFFGLNK